MMSRMRHLAAGLLVLATSVFAADVSGKWKAEMPGRNGETRTVTFNLKADGDKLTGTMSGGMGGDAKLQDGKVDGDNVSFNIVREFNGNSMKINYKGKLEGEELKMQMMREGADQPREFVAKRDAS